MKDRIRAFRQLCLRCEGARYFEVPSHHLVDPNILVDMIHISAIQDHLVIGWWPDTLWPSSFAYFTKTDRIETGLLRTFYGISKEQRWYVFAGAYDSEERAGLGANLMPGQEQFYRELLADLL